MPEDLPLINPDNLAPDVPGHVTEKVQIGKQWLEKKVAWQPQPVLYDMQDRGYTLPVLPAQPKPARWRRRLKSLFGV